MYLTEIERMAIKLVGETLDNRERLRARAASYGCDDMWSDETIRDRAGLLGSLEYLTTQELVDAWLVEVRNAMPQHIEVGETLASIVRERIKTAEPQ